MIETPTPAFTPSAARPFAARFTWRFNSAKSSVRSSK